MWQWQYNVEQFLQLKFKQFLQLERCEQFILVKFFQLKFFLELELEFEFKLKLKLKLKFI